MLKNKYFSLFVIILFPYIFNQLVNHQKSLTITTFLYSLLFYFFYKRLFSTSMPFFVFKNNILKIINNSYFHIIVLFIFTLLTQNRYLNIETITWDVPSYLVASQDINNGFLPFEMQWESKGPFFLYLYNFISNIANRNYLYFKILNDLVLFISTVSLYLTIKYVYKNKISAFFSSLLFVLITSHVWFISEFSEIYCLTFLAVNYYLHKRFPENNYAKFAMGVNFALSTLINQGTLIFILPYILISIINKDSNVISKIRNLLTGFLLPHVFFIILYYLNDLLEIYLSQYIQLPLNYVQSSDPSLTEILVIARRIFQHDYFLYFAIISMIFFLAIKLVTDTKNTFFKIEILNFIFGVLLFFIAGHSYQHHLFYAIFFFSVLIPTLKIPNHKQFTYLLIIFSFFSIGLKSFEESIYNLSNTKEIYNNYPLKNLAIQIQQEVGLGTFDILALDYVLVLYYLDLQNTSYIVHPGNHTEEYIVNELLRLDKISTNEFNHVSYLIEQEPRVIMCNPTIIVAGIPQKIDFYNCGIDDYKKNYYKLDTVSFKNDTNLNFYIDPYKEINVYIKDN